MRVIERERKGEREKGRECVSDREREWERESMCVIKREGESMI